MAFSFCAILNQIIFIPGDLDVNFVLIGLIFFFFYEQMIPRSFDGRP